jgi:hypothetical protein
MKVFSFIKTKKTTKVIGVIVIMRSYVRYKSLEVEEFVTCSRELLRYRVLISVLVTCKS